MPRSSIHADFERAMKGATAENFELNVSFLRTHGSISAYNSPQEVNRTHSVDSLSTTFSPLLCGTVDR
jgi:hypothetical protein